MFLLIMHVLELEKQLYNSLKAQTNHYHAGRRGLDLGLKKIFKSIDGDNIWQIKNTIKSTYIFH